MEELIHILTDESKKIENNNNNTNLFISGSTLTCLRVKLPTYLITLHINKTRIENIANVDFTLLVNLEELSLYDNHIIEFSNEIPEKLTDLNLSHNKLKSLNFDPKNLEKLDLQNNFLKEIPDCLHDTPNYININYAYNSFGDVITNTSVLLEINGKKIDKPKYNGNDLMRQFNRRVNLNTRTVTKPEPVKRKPVNENKRILNHYKDRMKRNENNVHETEIQAASRLAIKNLLKLKLKTSKRVIKELKTYYTGRMSLLRYLFSFFQNPFYKELEYYKRANFKYVYNYETRESLTFVQVLELVQAYIETQKDKHDLYESLKFQIVDGIHVCQTGKVTRILGALISSSNIMKIEKSTNEKISDKAVELKKKYKDNPEECKKELKIYMDELKICPVEQSVWLDSF